MADIFSEVPPFGLLLPGRQLWCTVHQRRRRIDDISNLLEFIKNQKYLLWNVVSAPQPIPQRTNCSYNYGQMHCACTKRPLPV